MLKAKLLPGNYPIQLLLMLLLGGLAGLVYMTLTPKWWLLFLGVALSVAIFINNRIGFFIILATLFVLNWLFGVFRVIPKEITWLPDVILMILSAKVIFLQSREKRLKGTPIDWVFMLILLLGLVSAIYNTVSPVTVIFGYRNFFKYTLMFYILRNLEPSEKFYRLFLIMLFVLAVAQIPITIGQAWYYGNTGEDVADNISGTLGWKATGAMALFMCFFISMITGFYVQQRKIIYGVIGIISLIPIMLGSGQFGFYIVPPAILLCWIFGSPKTLSNILKIPLVIAGLLAVIWIGINVHDGLYRGKLLASVKSPGKVYQFNLKTRKEGTFGRFQVIKVSNQLLAQHLPNLLIGFGPGNASESFFDEYKGKLEQQYQGRKITGIQLTAIILEFGYLGLLLFMVMFYCLLKMNWRLYYHSQHPFWKSIAVGYNGMVFTYLAGVIYNPVWFYDVLAFTFWFVSAALMMRWYQVMERKGEDDLA